MRTGKAAQALGVDKRTVTNWLTHPLLNRFFSGPAIGNSNGVERDISEGDLYTLNTIRVLRAGMLRNNTDWQHIADRLESGYRDKGLPPQAAAIDTGINPLVQHDQIRSAIEQRNFALQRVNELEHALADKDSKIDQLYEQWRKELGDLRAALARSEMELELWRAGRLKPD